MWFSRKKKVNDDEITLLDQKVKELQSIQVNTSTDRSIIARALSGGYDNADTLHNVYSDFGYPAEVTFQNLWNMYRRFGIAANVVNLPVQMTWVTNPTIEVSNSSFSSTLEDLADRMDFWQRLQGLDKRQRVGRYAGLFLRLRDGKQPYEPAQRVLPNALIDIMPIYEGQLKVMETDKDASSTTYGQPTLYQYNATSVGGRDENATESINIHPSRLVVVAEGSDDGSIYGIPALEPVYNSLMDLRKIIGAGAEGFYKNAAQNIIFKLMDPSFAHGNEKLLEEFNENYDEFSRNRQRRAMWTPGLDPELLGSNLAANPQGYFDSALNDVAAGSGIPATILIGKQTGRLASEEDGRAFLSKMNSRREEFGTELVRTVLDRLIVLGILPTASYDVVWDDLLAASDDEKLTAADKMAKINQTQYLSGGSPVFSEEEIREQAGYEPDDIPDEETGEDEVDEEVENEDV